MFSFKEYLEETKRTGCTCWTGYKRVPGTKPCAPGSCVKEEVELEEGYDKSSEHHKNARKMAKDYDGKATFHPNGHAEVRMRSIVHGHSTVNPQGTTLMSGEDLAKRASKEHGKGKVEGNIVHFKEESELDEAAVDAKGYKSSTGGLTQKGVDAYNRQSGGHLQMAVTTPPSKLKPGSKAANRRKSFCARMSGVDGPMKKPNGEPSRKALALRKWNC